MHTKNRFKLGLALIALGVGLIVAGMSGGVSSNERSGQSPPAFTAETPADVLSNNAVEPVAVSFTGAREVAEPRYVASAGVDVAPELLRRPGWATFQTEAEFKGERVLPIPVAV